MTVSSTHRQRKNNKGKFKPKGRIASKDTVEKLKKLLPECLKRDMLIEYLHLIQDEFCHLSSDNLMILFNLGIVFLIY